jgi:hypothetical protein
VYWFYCSTSGASPPEWDNPPPREEDCLGSAFVLIFPVKSFDISTIVSTDTSATVILLPKMSPTPVSEHAQNTISTPPGTYIYALARTPSSSNISCINSDNTLRHFSATTLTLLAAINLDSPVTSLSTGPTEHTLVTGVRGGKISLWDIRAGSHSVQEYSTPHNAPILCVAANLRSQWIAAGTELVGTTATVLLWDVRANGLIKEYKESHNDDVSTVGFVDDFVDDGIGEGHVVLVSGSTDGLVNIYDPSVMLGPGGTDGLMEVSDPFMESERGSVIGDDEVEGALRRVVNHGSSIHKAGIIPCSDSSGGEEIWALSHDEIFGIYSETQSQNFGDIRPTLNCEYVINMLSPLNYNNPKQQEQWIISGSTSEKAIYLTPFRRSSGKWVFGNTKNCNDVHDGGYTLIGGHGDEVCRDILVDYDVSSPPQVTSSVRFLFPLFRCWGCN